MQGFPYWGIGGQPKICSFTPFPPNYFEGDGGSSPILKKSIQPNIKIKTSFLAVVIAPIPFLFLISYYFETQIMLILILIDVQYSQNVVFSFEKFLNCQNHSFSGSHHLVKKSPHQCLLLFDAKSGKLLKF